MPKLRVSMLAALATIAFGLFGISTASAVPANGIAISQIAPTSGVQMAGYYRRGHRYHRRYYRYYPNYYGCYRPYRRYYGHYRPYYYYRPYYRLYYYW